MPNSDNQNGDSVHDSIPISRKAGTKLSSPRASIPKLPILRSFPAPPRQPSNAIKPSPNRANKNLEQRRHSRSKGTTVNAINPEVAAIRRQMDARKKNAQNLRAKNNLDLCRGKKLPEPDLPINSKKKLVKVPNSRNVRKLATTVSPATGTSLTNKNVRQKFASPAKGSRTKRTMENRVKSTSKISPKTKVKIEKRTPIVLPFDEYDSENYEPDERLSDGSENDISPKSAVGEKCKKETKHIPLTRTKKDKSDDPKKKPMKETEKKSPTRTRKHRNDPMSLSSSLEESPSNTGSMANKSNLSSPSEENPSVLNYIGTFAIGETAARTPIASDTYSNGSKSPESKSHKTIGIAEKKPPTGQIPRVLLNGRGEIRGGRTRPEAKVALKPDSVKSKDVDNSSSSSQYTTASSSDSRSFGSTSTSSSSEPSKAKKSNLKARKDQYRKKMMEYDQHRSRLRKECSENCTQQRKLKYLALIRQEFFLEMEYHMLLEHGLKWEETAEVRNLLLTAMRSFYANVTRSRIEGLRSLSCELEIHNYLTWRKVFKAKMVALEKLTDSTWERSYQNVLASFQDAPDGKDDQALILELTMADVKFMRDNWKVLKQLLDLIAGSSADLLWIQEQGGGCQMQ